MMYRLESEFLMLEIEIIDDEGARGEKQWVYRLIDNRSGRIFSDMDYYYGIGVKQEEPGVPDELLRGDIDPALLSAMLQPPKLPVLRSRELNDLGSSLLISGCFDNGLAFEHCFSLTGDGRNLIESIGLRNGGEVPAENLEINFGFRKMLYSIDGGFNGDVDGWDLQALPTRRYRAQKIDRRLGRFSTADLLYSAFDPSDGTEMPGFDSEAWVWGSCSSRLLISKYSGSEIEFSRFGRFPQLLPGRGRENTAVIFGGVSTGTGDPEGGCSIAPGGSYEYGNSSYCCFAGEWEEGALLYRDMLSRKGLGRKTAEKPLLHWNELYNLGWFAEAAGYFAEGLEFKMYGPAEILKEAELAAAAGAEVLYLDPGWDTAPGSTVWDSSRMGDPKELFKRIHEDYGLKVGLHLMMCFWSADEDESFFWRDQNGRPCRDPEDTFLFRFCPNSRWMEEKTARIRALAEAGADFLMFDFTGFGMRGEGCRCAEHGHEVPMRRQTHAENLLSVIRAVKNEFPEIVIEAHDRLRGGFSDYHPPYYQYEEGVFDELWGFEYMWNPMQDLLSGKALSLYEYRMSYPVPVYLHINEGCDNPAMLQFWWYASTVQHLGIGGLADCRSDAFMRLQSAVGLYKKLRSEVSGGVFYGIDPLAHLHIAEDGQSAALCAFNLGGTKEHRMIMIDEAGYNLEIDDRMIECCGGTGEPLSFECSRFNNQIRLEVDIPPLSPVIFVFNKVPRKR